METKKRKIRSDRTHVLYVMTCVATGLEYVGLTVQRGTVNRSLQIRLTQHLHRAWVEESDRVLSKALRANAAWTIDPIMTVRGKLEAHKMEVAIIDGMTPELNMLKKA